MKFQIAIFFSFALITVTLGRRARIVGGTQALISEFPSQVSIRIYEINEHFCSGVIITEKHILTAGHCFYQRMHIIPDTRVFIGTNSPYATGGLRMKIVKVVVHPEYTGKVSHDEAWIHDIAVAELKKKLTFTDVTKKIPLPNQDIQVNTTAIITGYGKTSYATMLLSDYLNKVSMKIIDTATCSDKLKRTIQDSQSCLLQGLGIGGCNGDSGGPVIQNGTVIGIQSWVIPCAQGHPDVFTKVYPHLAFINDCTQ